MVVGALVIAGVLPLSIVLYAALFGGCALMHVVGHAGHGGGSDVGRGHSGHGGGKGDSEDLSRRSSCAQPSESGSAAGLDQCARNRSTTREIDDHDDHHLPGCH